MGILRFFIAVKCLRSRVCWWKKGKSLQGLGAALRGQPRFHESKKMKRIFREIEDIGYFADKRLELINCPEKGLGIGERESRILY